MRLFTEQKDYLAGMSNEEKKTYLGGISYLDLLKQHVQVDDQILELYRPWGMSLVVEVKHTADARAVEVEFVRDGLAHLLQADRCVMVAQANRTVEEISGL